MSDKYDEDEICPVCGYYCLGKGGVGCIDKAGKLDADLSTLERWERKDWERRNPGKTLHDAAMENVQKLRDMGSESSASPACSISGMPECPQCEKKDQVIDTGHGVSGTDGYGRLQEADQYWCNRCSVEFWY